LTERVIGVVFLCPLVGATGTAARGITSSIVVVVTTTAARVKVALIAIATTVTILVA
jgi:hypothetical protein